MSQTTLDTLQCHFTWDLDCSRSILLLLKDKLEDICSEEGNRWLGPIYNLQGFIQYKLERHEDALSLFNKAAEAFCKVRGADQGPWLVVNYGNLAWLHHQQGDQDKSRDYLSKIDALMREYPSPTQGELHAEVCAEKAWTLMKFGQLRNQEAAECFETALRMQPDVVEWNTYHVIGLVQAQNLSLLTIMRQAKERDPENLFLAVLYLEQRAKTGERIDHEARKFARDNMETLSCSYQALKALLWVYKNFLSVDEAIELAEEALRLNPDQRYLKKCAALCYEWKIVLPRDPKSSQAEINRAISLQEEVLALYPDSPVMMKANLASLYAKSDSHKAKAKQMFQGLFQTDLTPAERQILYSAYAKYLYFDEGDSSSSITYHKMVVDIPVDSSFRERSITVLRKLKDKDPEIKKFLQNLKLTV